MVKKTWPLNIIEHKSYPRRLDWLDRLRRRRVGRITYINLVTSDESESETSQPETSDDDWSDDDENYHSEDEYPPLKPEGLDPVPLRERSPSEQYARLVPAPVVGEESRTLLKSSEESLLKTEQE
jgi:hypothetical protein